MIPDSYFIFIQSTFQLTLEDTVIILNTAGFGQPIFGSTDETGSQELRIISKAKNSVQEIENRLRAIPAIREIFIAPLSNPVDKAELPEVRKLLLKLYWNAEDVSDEDLSKYINSELQRQHEYFIDFDHKKIRKKIKKISIKPIQEHAYFSPELLSKRSQPKDFPIDREFTLADFTSETYTFTSTISKASEAEQGPEPPPPPNDLDS